MRKNKCLRCEYEWEGRIKTPKACPYCKSMKWNVPKKEKLENGNTKKLGNSTEKCQGNNS